MMSVSASFSGAVTSVVQSRLLTFAVLAFLLCVSTATALLLSLAILLGGSRIGIGSRGSVVSRGTIPLLALAWAPTVSILWALCRALRFAPPADAG